MLCLVRFIGLTIVLLLRYTIVAKLFEVVEDFISNSISTSRDV